MRERRLAQALLLICPGLLASNMLVARLTHELVPPVALALGRWGLSLLLLLPFTGLALWRLRAEVGREWRDLLVLGGLGMGVCGAFVYIGADATTATNIGLIYAASPILIVLLARLGYGERLRPWQILGVMLCLLGVLIIIARGDPQNLWWLRFNAGDLWILAATVAWAGYSVLLRHRPSRLSPSLRFTAICLAGVLVLLPAWGLELLGGAMPVLNRETVMAVVFLAVVSSLLAYQVYGRIQRSLGAGPTGVVMYLVPVYNGALAWLLLGEQPHGYHLLGAGTVLPGLYLATRWR